MNLKKVLLGMSSLLFSSSILFAADVPPQGSKSALEIVKNVESLNLGVITNIEFDDGRWEVELFNPEKSEEVSLYLDATSGKVSHQHSKPEKYEEIPAKGSKLLSEILANAKNLAVVVEAEFDNGVWEVKHLKDGVKTKVLFDPATGNTK